MPIIAMSRPRIPKMIARDTSGLRVPWCELGMEEAEGMVFGLKKIVEFMFDCLLRSGDV
jgi:hypothetical protein